MCNVQCTLFYIHTISAYLFTSSEKKKFQKPRVSPSYLSFSLTPSFFMLFIFFAPLPELKTINSSSGLFFVYNSMIPLRDFFVLIKIHWMNFLYIILIPPRKVISWLSKIFTWISLSLSLTWLSAINLFTFLRAVCAEKKEGNYVKRKSPIGRR